MSCSHNVTPLSESSREMVRQRLCQHHMPLMLLLLHAIRHRDSGLMPRDRQRRGRIIQRTNPTSTVNVYRDRGAPSIIHVLCSVAEFDDRPRNTLLRANKPESVSGRMSRV